MGKASAFQQAHRQTHTPWERISGVCVKYMPWCLGFLFDIKYHAVGVHIWHWIQNIINTIIAFIDFSSTQQHTAIPILWQHWIQIMHLHITHCIIILPPSILHYYIIGLDTVCIHVLVRPALEFHKAFEAWEQPLAVCVHIIGSQQRVAM